MARNPFSIPTLPGTSNKLPSDKALNPKPVMVRPEQPMNPEARAVRFRRLASILGRPRGTGLAAPAQAPAMQPIAPLAQPLGPKSPKLKF